MTPGFLRGTKRLASINIYSVEGNSGNIFVSIVSPEIFVLKVTECLLFSEGYNCRSGCDKSPATIFGKQISAAKFVE